MHNSNARTWLGIILVVIGTLLVIDNFGFFYFDFRHLIFSWHTIFIIIGLILLINSKNSTVGIIFLVIGLFGIFGHLLNPFFLLTFRDFWPLIIIIIGLLIILKKNGHKHIEQNENNFDEHNTSKGVDELNISTINTDLIDETCILTHCKKNIVTNNFKGGSLTIIAASANINLVQSTLAPGEHILDVTCIGGGCSIIIPNNWKVVTNITTIFGGFDTKQYFVDNSSLLSDGLLIVRGTILFGGGELKSAQ